MTSEQRLHQWLRKQLDPCDYQRVEGAATGFPDVNVARYPIHPNFQHLARSIWIELKVITKGRTLLRKEQYAWGVRRLSYGEAVWIVSWHEKLDRIFVFKYHDNMQVGTYGKYVQVNDLPLYDDFRVTIPIKTILFPSVS